MIDEPCLGSRCLPVDSTVVEDGESETGECLVCGQRVALGYGGLVVAHQTVAR
jgi:hypothetical protein